MSSILDTSSLYSAYGQSVQNASTANLQGTLGSISENASEDELMSACKSFEAYFVQKIIEQAKSSVAGDEEEDGEYMQYFGDLLNEQYANMVAESGSTGLAQQLYDSMKSSYNL